MTDDQKPYDDDLTFDDAPVVPEDPRSLDEGDDFLDEVDEPEREGDFLTAEDADPEEGPGFAVHHRGAELFGGQPETTPEAADHAAESGGTDLAAESGELDFLDEDTEMARAPMPGEAIVAVESEGAEGTFDPYVEVDAGLESTEPAVSETEVTDFEVNRAAEPAEQASAESAPGDDVAAGVPDASFEDVFDDVFVIEFGSEDADDDFAAELETAEGDELTPMAALAPEIGDDAEPVDADATTEFREDRAGWLGEDLSLAEFVGERAPVADDSVDLFEEDSAADEDPFAIDEVELEVEDAADDDDESDSFDFVLQGDASAASDGGDEDDAWAPLSDGESWVMGSDLGAMASEQEGVDGDAGSEDADQVEEDLAPVFGMGRFDPTLSGDGANVDESDVENGFFAPDEIEAEREEVEADHADPIYGDVGAGIDEVEPQPYGDADQDEAGLAEDADFGDEFDDTYVEQEPTHGRVIGALRGAGRSPWTKVAAALLVTIGAAGGTVATMRPEWFGFLPGALTPERVEVARPRIEVTPIVAVPETEAPKVIDAPSGPEVPAETESVAETTADAAAIEMPDPAAVPSAPLVETAPPVRVSDVPSTREITESPRPIAPRPAPAFVGFETRDGMEIHDLTDAVPPRVAGVQVVSPGERAFAQLRNAEIFVGVVKSVEASFVTLDLEPGEISLSRSSLTTLTPLASTDATEMLAAQHGYVRLPTEARLWGQILRNSTNEDVILQTEDARIRVPRGSVVQLQGSDPARTALVDSQDDSWLDARIREQLRAGDDAASRSRRR